MRDLNRIPIVMNLITQIWSKQPDTRFNQLIDDLQWEYANGTGRHKLYLYAKEEIQNGLISFIPSTVVDLFYVEDDDFLEFLENKANADKGD